MKGFLTANDHVIAFFRAVLEPVDVRDEKGNLLGHFTPYVPPEVIQIYEEAKKSFDLVEVKRRLSESGGRRLSTAEVLEHLRQLENQACDSR